MDGSMNIPAQMSTTLFNGALPPNGFMIQMQAVSCWCGLRNQRLAAGNHQQQQHQQAK
jgi:hypothetical protein